MHTLLTSIAPASDALWCASRARTAHDVINATRLQRSSAHSRSQASVIQKLSTASVDISCTLSQVHDDDDVKPMLADGAVRRVIALRSFPGYAQRGLPSQTASR